MIYVEVEEKRRSNEARYIVKLFISNLKKKKKKEEGSLFSLPSYFLSLKKERKKEA